MAKAKEYIWLKPHHKYAYVKGDVCGLPKAQADDLIKGGFVEEFKRPVAKKKETATK